MSKLAFRVVFYCQRSYQVAENFINHKTLFGLGVYQNENLLALKYLAILDLCSFVRFVSYPSRFFFFYFFPFIKKSCFARISTAFCARKRKTKKKKINPTCATNNLSFSISIRFIRLAQRIEIVVNFK